MEATEGFIRRRVQLQLPSLVDDIKKLAAERVCDYLLESLVENPKNVEFDFYLQHSLVQDILVIIDQEIEAYLQPAPKTRTQKKKLRSAT